MKRSILFSIVTLVVLIGTYNYSYAVPPVQPKDTPVEMQRQRPPHHDFNKPPKGNFEDEQRPPQFDKMRPSKAEMDAKKAEFEKRLNLTEAQKKKIENYKEKDREKIKPVMKKMHENREAIWKVKHNPNLSEKDKETQLKQLRKEKQSLKQTADKYRQENMKNFESVLNADQKKEFEKIKAEQKKFMEERRKEFENQRKHEPCPLGMAMPE